MSLAAEAVRLHTLGFDPIRLVPGEKRPAGNEWQRQHGRTTDEVAADFGAHPDAGLGVLTGRGLVVIDSDFKPDLGVNGQATISLLGSTTLGPLPATVTARTASGGYHFYFRVPRDIRVPNSVGKLGPGVDVRGEGGQVVCAPTVLASGRPYEWLDGIGGGQPTAAHVPAELPAKWLAACLAQPAAPASPAAPALPPGAERLTGPVSRASGFARAAAYVAAIEGAVAGQGGHDQTFDVACRICERVTCVEDAATVLWTYNDRCKPPWSVAELTHKLDSALAKHPLPHAPVEAVVAAAPASAPTPAAPSTDELVDTITEADNQPYWLALRAWNKDHPDQPLPEQLDDEVSKLLKNSPRVIGTKASPYLDSKHQLLHFKGYRPSQYAYDEHKARPWRRLQAERWSDGASREAIQHELDNSGLNKRSSVEFQRRVRHVADAICVYDSAERFIVREGASVLNVYEPSTLQPEAGGWEPIRRVLLNLHSGHSEHVEWTMDWLATVLRDVRAGRPRLTGVAVVFYGPQQGAGKGVMETVLRALVGVKNLATVGQAQLDEAFNGWFSGKLLAIGNEVFSSENRTETESNKLKPYISDPRIQIREMYAAPMERDNVCNLWFFANGFRPVVAEQHDRRFTMFKVGGAIDPKLGELVADDARAGGPMVRAFLHELLTRGGGRFTRFTPLQTEAKSEVQYDVSSSAEKFLHELSKGDGFHELAQDYLRECGASELYVHSETETLVERRIFFEVYRRWASASGYRPVAASQLFRLARSAGLVDERKRVGGGKQVRAFAGVPGIFHERGLPAASVVHPNVEAAQRLLEAP